MIPYFKVLQFAVRKVQGLKLRSTILILLLVLVIFSFWDSVFSHLYTQRYTTEHSSKTRLTWRPPEEGMLTKSGGTQTYRRPTFEWRDSEKSLEGDATLWGTVDDKKAYDGPANVVYIYFCPGEEFRKPWIAEWALEAYERHLQKLHPHKSLAPFVVEKHEIDQSMLSERLPLGHLSLFMSSQRFGTKCMRKIEDETKKAVFDKMIRFSDAGEVYGQFRYSCEEIDLMVDRSKERVKYNNGLKECLAVHYVQGFALATRNKTSKLMNKLCDAPSAEWMAKRMKEKRPGVALLAVSRVIKRGVHWMEALIRGAFLSILKNRFPNEGYDGTHAFIREAKGSKNWTGNMCIGTFMNVAGCKRDYDFSIDMENSAVEGYVSEKILTGILAGTVPVYYGAPDVNDYINPKRFLNCAISPERVKELNDLKEGKTFTFANVTVRSDAYDSSLLLELVTDFLKDDLEPCIQQFLEIKSNRTKYFEMVSQFPLANRELCKDRPAVSAYIGGDMFNAVQSLKRDRNIHVESLLFLDDMIAV